VNSLSLFLCLVFFYFAVDSLFVLTFVIDASVVFLLFDRFDGRALLDFIRESGTRRALQKSEEEEELEEFVNFERYRDLIKHRRRGCRYFFFYFLMIMYTILVS